MIRVPRYPGYRSGDGFGDHAFPLVFIYPREKKSRSRFSQGNVDRRVEIGIPEVKLHPVSRFHSVSAILARTRENRKPVRLSMLEGEIIIYLAA